MVSKGYAQQEGLDFIETLSPMAKLVIVRVLLAIVASNSLPLVYLDVNCVFLNGDLFEEVYMDLTLRYYPYSSRSQIQGDKLVCKLHRSIYGLKQGSRQWFSKFSIVLIAFSFQQCKTNNSLFTKDTGPSFLALLVYVSDIILTGFDSHFINHMKSFLHIKCKLKDLGSLKYFLGLEFARSQKGIFLSQRHYALQILEDVGFLGCKPASLPMDPNLKLNAFEGDLLQDASLYRRLVGKLIYFTISQPNITFVVHKLSHYVS